MQVSESVQLVEDLVGHFPVLQDAYDSHIFNEGGVLPHVFFWDLTQEVIRAFISGGGEALDWKGVLDFLEERIGAGNQEVVEVIVTSFLSYMPYPTQSGYHLVDELGAVMSRRFRDLRGGGDSPPVLFIW